MNRQKSLVTSRGLTDATDRLISADETLAELQEKCGGTIPGTIAVPELLDLVRQARLLRLKLAREFSAFDGSETVRGFARINPQSEALGDGCEVLIENWQHTAQPLSGSLDAGPLLDEIDRATAEINAQLGADQRVHHLHADAPDGEELHDAVKAQPGKVWSEYLELHGVVHEDELHWQMLDGVRCSIPGSPRPWRVRLIPLGHEGATLRGFELLLIAEAPPVPDENVGSGIEETTHSRLIGSALTPTLRQPIARIIANAETMRARLAGPLRAEYSEYAGHIASAGQHLSAMLDDLVDLEVVEAPDYSTARERVDLVDAARRAAGILGVRAQARGIAMVLPESHVGGVVVGEFRRVLQILINLIGNAIAYSPENSTVELDIAPARSGFIALCVRDEGPGVDRDQAARIFDKFERLGRDSDGNEAGSGLGLYISRKLALVMGGDLECVPVNDDDMGKAGQSGGTVFRLTLPAE